MRKILIGVLILLLLFGIFTVIVKGINVFGFDIYGYQKIQEMNDELDSEITQAGKLTSLDYPEKLSNLTTTGKKLATTKEQYQDKITYSSEEDIKLAMQVKEFKLEFLYTKIGNYRLKEGIDVELSFEQKSTADNNWDIHIIVVGKYLPITEFIRDLEDDDELNFRIENFKMVPRTNKSTEILRADFYVRNIGLTEVDVNIENATISDNVNDNSTVNSDNIKNNEENTNNTTSSNTTGTNNTINTNSAS